MLAMLGKICVFLLLFPIFGVAAEKRMDMSGGVVNGPIMLSDNIRIMNKSDLYNRFSGIKEKEEIEQLIDVEKYKEAIRLLEKVYAERKYNLIQATKTVNTLLSSLVALKEMKGGYFYRPLSGSISNKEVKRVEQELVYDLSIALANRAENKALSTNAIIDVALVDALSQRKEKVRDYKKFQVAIADAPDPMFVYYYYSQVLRDNGDAKLANTMLDKAIAYIAKKESISKKTYAVLDRGDLNNQLKSKFGFIYAFVKNQRFSTSVESGKYGLKLQAKKQLKHGQVEAAEKSLEGLPENNKSDFLRAKVYMLLGEIKRAHATLDGIYASANDDVLVLIRLSSLYLEIGQFEQVKELYNQVVQLKGIKKEWSLLMTVNKELADLLNGKPTSSLIHIVAWNKKDGSGKAEIMVRIYAARGRYYNFNDNYRMAEQNYKLAIEMYQKGIQGFDHEDDLLLSEVYVGLANAQFRVGHINAARATFKKVLTFKNMDVDLAVMKEARLGVFFSTGTIIKSQMFYKASEKILKIKTDSYTVVNMLTSNKIQVLNPYQTRERVIHHLKSPILKKRMNLKIKQGKR